MWEGDGRRAQPCFYFEVRLAEKHLNQKTQFHMFGSTLLSHAEIIPHDKTTRNVGATVTTKVDFSINLFSTIR